ncbi:hypothetical protein [Azospirillum thermophilum]|nr:hypothetical protein [Azospirillum thermophilum]
MDLARRITLGPADCLERSLPGTRQAAADRRDHPAPCRAVRPAEAGAG